MFCVHYFYAGLLRSNEAGQTKFGEKDGYSLLLRAMQASDNKLKTKSTFLLKALMTENPALKGMLRCYSTLYIPNTQ